MLLVCGCCRGGGGAEFSERSSGQRDAVRVVHQAIHDRVAEGGVPDAFVPVLDGDLTGEQRGAPARAIFDHLRFSLLVRAARRGASFTNPWGVRDAIDAFIKVNNPRAAPFEWRKEVVHAVALQKRYSDLRK